MTEELFSSTISNSAIEASSKKDGYCVLARKYRPTNFAELVGQEALVRTLTNAIKSGRLAHAFMLTGVRGIGKTTTARIIARALNCTGISNNAPAVEPCGTCDSCVSISQDRHVDVIEMDAASRTGVDDIREIIEGVRYAPVSGRYKIYIIDEVHMLSKNAFNALLKTLEEPPPHVKFIFATTEIRKVPVTVLSRCQRFDLKRVDVKALTTHYENIAKKENISVEKDALAIIAKAADGSVRDGLSLLDRAMAMADGAVTTQQVAKMLGLADRSIIMDLFEAAVTGKTGHALDILADMYQNGAEPILTLQDLLELAHNLTRAKLVPGEVDNAQVKELAATLTIPQLTRAWQTILKGISEVQASPLPYQTLEMIIVRLLFSADMPTPSELIKTMKKTESSIQSSAVLPQPTSYATQSSGNTVVKASVEAAVPESRLHPVNETTSLASFEELVQLLRDKKEMVLYGYLYNSVHPVRFAEGVIEIRLDKGLPPDFATRLAKYLRNHTGKPWVVGVSKEEGQPTLAERAQKDILKDMEIARNNSLVNAVLAAFPGAVITSVQRKKAELPTEPPVADYPIYNDEMENA